MVKGTKKTELDVCKANCISKPAMCDNFVDTADLQYTFINHMKAENQQMNISEVN
jgi:hypothetical protein